VLSTIESNVPAASAQQDSTNFLTYTSTGLGFTIKYPSNWTVDDNAVVNDSVVAFIPPDRVGIVSVGIGNATAHQIELNNMNDDSAKINAIKSHLFGGEKLLELDVSRYLLSGHPAIRLVEIQSFGGPGQPQSPQYPEPHDTKAMLYNLILDGKWYNVAYSATPPEDFPKYLQTAQSMIDSFQIISKQ
jgi:hypothetical protein